jgi:outer membrane immunogenic protein
LPYHFITAAHAGDYDWGPLRGPQYAEPALSPVAVWEGIYFGGFGGFAQTDFHTKSVPYVTATFTDPLLSTLPIETKDANAASFGGFVGYNSQFEEIVLGVEADYTHARMRAISFAGYTNTVLGSTTPPFAFTGPAVSTLDDYGTLRARAGYTAGPFMPFITAGIAIGRSSVTYPDTTLLGAVYPAPLLPSVVPVGPKDKIVFGFTAGAGVDFQLFQNVFLRAEYQYVHFDTFQNSKPNVHAGRAGVGLKF